MIKLFVILAVTYVSVMCKLIVEESKTLHIDFTYVKQVFFNLSFVNVPTTVLLNNDEEVILPPALPSVRINNTEKNCFKSHIEPHLYVVDLRTITLEKVILAFRSKCVFNPRVLFYFIVNSTFNFETNNLAQNYISNFIISDIRGQMLTCYTDTSVKRQQFCANNTKNIWYPSSTRTKSSLDIVLRITNPYVTGSGTGLEEQLLKYIHDWLKINVTFKYLPFGV